MQKFLTALAIMETHSYTEVLSLVKRTIKAMLAQIGGKGDPYILLMAV